MNFWDFYSYKIIGKLATFFTGLGARLPEPTSDQLNFRHVTFFDQFFEYCQSKIDSILTNLSSSNLVFIFRCSSSPRNPVYVSRVDPSP